MFIVYQCIQKCGNILIAASISRLDSFSLEDGSLLSSWSFPALSSNNLGEFISEEVNGNRVAPDIASSPANTGQESRRPTKRRRVSNNEDDKDTVDRDVETRENKHSDATKNPSQTPSITALKSTSDGSHMIVVTGEDKSIHVFKHNGRGELQHLSQRAMPKRPCALAITATDSTIICADKFGDVYSLPLLISDPPVEGGKADETFKPHQPFPNPSKAFLPAANDLTIHTVRNRKALQNQMRTEQHVSRKPGPSFVLNLLFGHVSMLTDVAVVEHNGRNYIITSDRDEHIRISRGIPQTHVIEGYCLGHKEFVSRICLPVAKSDVLISGGGDDEIYIWDWVHGKPLHTVNLRYEIDQIMKNFVQPLYKTGTAEGSKEVCEPAKIAVSNIRCVEKSFGQPGDIVIITCEGIPALLIYSLLHDFNMSHSQTLKLDGNPLDIIVNNSTGSIMVSIDCVHRPGSTTQLRAPEDIEVTPLRVFRYSQLQWVDIPFQFDCDGKKEVTCRGHSKKDIRSLSSVLYTLENLRKRGGEE